MRRKKYLTIILIIIFVFFLLVIILSFLSNNVRLGINPVDFKRLENNFFNTLSQNCEDCNCPGGVIINKMSKLGFNNMGNNIYLSNYFFLIGDLPKMNHHLNCSINFLLTTLSQTENLTTNDKFLNAIYLFRFFDLYQHISTKNKSIIFTLDREYDLNQKLKELLLEYSNVSTSSYYLIAFIGDLAKSYLILGEITNDKDLILKSKHLILKNKRNISIYNPPNYPYSLFVYLKDVAFVCSLTNDTEICSLARNYTDYLLSIQKSSGQICPYDKGYRCNPPLVTYQAVQALDYYYDYSKDERVKEAVINALIYILNFVDSKEGGIVENYYRNKYRHDLPQEYQKTISLNYEITRLFYKYFPED